tara:strand:+ start:375 stop:776 length:402 start_codon:yes stop_codon:yes gene_type:complete
VKKTLMTLALIGASTSAYAETVQDFNKTVINRVPYNVEVCTNQTMSGDKTGDTLKGAIIGGIIGNNVGDVKNGGALGAVLGGMIGHNNSNATGGTRRVCEVQTRYNEESVTIYSHSVVTFYHEGKQYKLRFQK